MWKTHNGTTINAFRVDRSIEEMKKTLRERKTGQQSKQTTASLMETTKGSGEHHHHAMKTIAKGNELFCTTQQGQRKGPRGHTHGWMNFKTL